MPEIGFAFVSHEISQESLDGLVADGFASYDVEAAIEGRAEYMPTGGYRKDFLSKTGIYAFLANGGEYTRKPIEVKDYEIKLDPDADLSDLPQVDGQGEREPEIPTGGKDGEPKNAEGEGQGGGDEGDMKLDGERQSEQGDDKPESEGDQEPEAQEPDEQQPEPQGEHDHGESEGEWEGPDEKLFPKAPGCQGDCKPRQDGEGPECENCKEKARRKEEKQQRENSEQRQQRGQLDEQEIKVSGLTKTQVDRFQNLFERISQKTEATFGKTAEDTWIGEIQLAEIPGVARSMAITSRGVTYTLTFRAERED